MTALIGDIVDALLAYADTMIIGSPILPIALPDIGFNTATDAPDGNYLEVSVLPNRPLWEGLTQGRQEQGLVQVSVVWKSGQGVVKAYEAAAAVMAHFAKNTLISSSSGQIKISREPWTSPPLIEDGKTTVPVTVSWTA